MFPTALLESITLERQNVPLPAGVEAFLVILMFDILRETGIRMPAGIGQALSIVGAIVIGQAAVEAKLIAASMIIVVALTGITNLLIPKMNASVILVRLFLLALSVSFGFFGFILGLSCVLIHILNLRTFGMPVLSSINIFDYQDVKDSVIRGSWTQMLTRPKIMAKDSIRMKAPKGDNHD